MNCVTPRFEILRHLGVADLDRQNKFSHRLMVLPVDIITVPTLRPPSGPIE